MDIFIKCMNRITSLAYWLMVGIVISLISFAIFRVATGSMDRQSGAEFMLVGGMFIGGSMFLFLILKIITSLMEENSKRTVVPKEPPSDV